MKRNSYFLGFAEVALAEGGRSRIQILRAAEFLHPTTGKTIKVTTDHLRSVLSSFQRNARGIDLAINYEHRRSPAHGTKAAGWIKSLTVEGDGTELWAEVEWTPTALREVGDKEFRYLSAEIDFDYVDNMSGRREGVVLTGAALTNTPVVKGMQAIAASELDDDQQSSERTKPMNLSELKIKLADFGVNLAELEGKAQKLAAVEVELSEAKTELSTVKAEAAGLKTRVTELSEQLDAVKKAQAEAGFKALVEKGMADGRLTKEFAEGHFRQIFEKSGLEFAESMLSSMPKVIDVTPAAGSGADSGAGAGKDAGSQVEALAEKLMAADSKLDFSEAVDRVLKAHPDLAKAYGELGA